MDRFRGYVDVLDKIRFMFSTSPIRFFRWNSTPFPLPKPVLRQDMYQSRLRWRNCSYITTSNMPRVIESRTWNLVLDQPYNKQIKINTTSYILSIDTLIWTLWHKYYTTYFGPTLNNNFIKIYLVVKFSIYLHDERNGKTNVVIADNISLEDLAVHPFAEAVRAFDLQKWMNYSSSRDSSSASMSSATSLYSTHSFMRSENSAGEAQVYIKQWTEVAYP